MHTERYLENDGMAFCRETLFQHDLLKIQQQIQDKLTSEWPCVSISYVLEVKHHQQKLTEGQES